MSAPKKELTKQDKIEAIQSIILEECKRLNLDPKFITGQDTLEGFRRKEYYEMKSRVRLARIEIAARMTALGCAIYEIGRIINVSDSCVWEYLRLSKKPRNERTTRFKKNKSLSS